MIESWIVRSFEKLTVLYYIALYDIAMIVLWHSTMF
jgi:hypothetical protein